MHENMNIDDVPTNVMENPIHVDSDQYSQGEEVGNARKTSKRSRA